eukprot:354468-Chlamydomonas_euryale.AAC.4
MVRVGARGCAGAIVRLHRRCRNTQQKQQILIASQVHTKVCFTRITERQRNIFSCACGVRPPMHRLVPVLQFLPVTLPIASPVARTPCGTLRQLGAAGRVLWHRAQRGRVDDED